MGVTKRGSVWYVKWCTAAGRWQRRATACKTKAEALKLHAELVVQADRQRRGLEPRPLQTGETLWKLCEWWLEKKCPKASYRRAKSLLDKHVRRSGLGELALTAMLTRSFNDYFDELASQSYHPRTINQLRLRLCAVFTQAKKAGRWIGESPARESESRPWVRVPRPVLAPEEVAPVIHAVPKNWRGFFATAAYLGLRKGELCGALKTDYDRDARQFYVGRSYGAEMTKGKRVDWLPVSRVLAPYLDAQLDSPGPFMFPGPKGKMRGEYAAPEDILRVAFKRLGMITGWAHKCRRCKARGRKTEPVIAADAEKRKCAVCNFTLWPVAIPRAMKFHDLRHTAATHLLKQGVPVQHVQRILRHSSIATTVDTYGHLLGEDLREALDRLGPRPVQPATLRALSAKEGA